MNKQPPSLIALSLLLLANPVFSQTTESSSADQDFMFIYPTISGPAIEFKDKTYGTGFGIDTDLVKELKGNALSTALVDSYGGKILWGNLVFYPGLCLLPFGGAGLPVVLIANTINGSAYEDLSRSVNLYNPQDADKVVFDLRQFGYKLRWNDAVYDPHDPAILSVLSADAGVKTFVEGYQSKSKTASIMAWTSFLYPVAGFLLGFALTQNSSSYSYQLFGGAMVAIGGAGVGLASWVGSSLVGSSAEADLVQAVRLYNQSH